MTEVHQYWTSLKEPGLAAVDLVAVEVVVAEVLEGADLV